MKRFFHSAEVFHKDFSENNKTDSSAWKFCRSYIIIHEKHIFQDHFNAVTPKMRCTGSNISSVHYTTNIYITEWQAWFKMQMFSSCHDAPPSIHTATAKHTHTHTKTNQKNKHGSLHSSSSHSVVFKPTLKISRNKMTVERKQLLSCEGALVRLFVESLCTARVPSVILAQTCCSPLPGMSVNSMLMGQLRQRKQTT